MLVGVGARPSTENRQSGPPSFFTITSGPDRDTGLQIPSSSSCACCLLKATWKGGKERPDKTAKHYPYLLTLQNKLTIFLLENNILTQLENDNFKDTVSYY